MNQIQPFLQQIKSPDPAARRDAIISLGKAANPAAISALTEISQNDPDLRLRDFARKAIQHIQKVREQASQPIDVSPTPLPPARMGEFEEPSDDLMGLPPAASAPPIILPTEPSGPPPKEPSLREKLLAKGHLEHALGLRVGGDNEKAFTMLTEALRLDPVLAKESTALNLASVLLNKPPAEAMKIVLRRSQDDHTRSQGVYSGGLRGLTFDKQFWNFALEAAILLVILILFSAVIHFGVFRVLNNLMSNFRMPDQLSADRAALVADDLAQMRAELSKIQPIDLVIASLQTGVVLMFLILLGNSIIYGVGILLGGTGLVFHFLGAMLRVQIVTYLALGIMLALLWFGGLQSSSDSDIGPIVTGLSFILLLIASFVSFVAHVIIAGRANETGIAKGLLSVVIGGMIVGFLVSTLRVLG